MPDVVESARVARLLRWSPLFLLPLCNIVAALLLTALVIAVIGDDPIACLQILLYGAFGYSEGLSYTLFYTTGFIFTGLAVAVAYQAGLFNIGGEGQVYLAGLGISVVALSFDAVLPFWVLIPLCMLAAMVFGATWALIPAYLQATRGSHIVVTTMMFNFIAYSLMLYAFRESLTEAGTQNLTTRVFAESAWVPTLHDLAAHLGFSLPATPLNASFFLALLVSALFYLGLSHSRLGYEIRTVGANADAARYCGMPIAKIMVLAMCASGALMGFAAFNELLGFAHRMHAGFTNGVGFVGIAVALMGHSHPVGIFFAALLFGALAQGGTELSFERPLISPEMILFIQGLVILFCGGLGRFFAPCLAKLLRQRGQSLV